MKTKIFILGIVQSPTMMGAAPAEMNTSIWYATGAFIGLFLLAYLIYALVKPEKF